MSRRKQKTDHRPASLRLPAWAPPALLLALGLAWVYHCIHFRFVQDDSFITFRYVRHLVDGHGLVFNLGERVEGYTTFLWTILLAVPGFLRLDLESSARVLGIVSGLAMLYLLWRLSVRVSQPSASPIIPLISVALTAANSSIAYWSVSGMETPLFAALLLAAVLAFLRERDAAFLWTPILFLLVSLTRPEGTLLFGLTVVFFVLERLARRHSVRALLPQAGRLLGLYAVPFVLFMAWRFSYYGHLFPNTYYAKAGFSVEYLTAGWDYLLLFLRTSMLEGALVAVPVAYLLWKRRTPDILYLLLMSIGYSVYVVSVGGDVLHAFRFFVPVLPLFYLFVQEALVGLTGVVSRSVSAARWLPVAAGALLAVVTFTQPYEYIREKWGLEIGLVDKMTSTGRWLASNSDSSTVVAASTIGALAYYGGVTLVDMLGLTDSTIAHHPEYLQGIESGWKERKYNTSYVLSRKPEWIFFSTGVKPSAFAERALFTRAEFRRHYSPRFFHLDGDAASLNVAYRRSADPLVDPSIPPDTSSGAEFINDFYIGMNLRRTPSDALKLFTKALRTAPKDFAMLHQEIANAHRSMGNPKAAEEWYRKAIAINPAMVESQIMLGVLARDRGDLAASGRHFREAVRFNPEYTMPWTLLGEQQLSVRDTAGAMASVRAALRIAPNNRDAAAILARLSPRP
jgi:tetratricopeptide (TPR) repeat protein